MMTGEKPYIRPTCLSHIPFQKIAFGHANSAAEVQCAFTTPTKGADDEDLREVAVVLCNALPNVAFHFHDEIAFCIVRFLA